MHTWDVTVNYSTGAGAKILIENVYILFQPLMQSRQIGIRLVALLLLSVG